MSIWNINSFAEYFLQIYEKYAKEYEAATRKLAAEREWFMASLHKLTGVRVIPSQANYVMVELQGDLSATELTKCLLTEHEILVKDLSSKTGGEYLRIAVRNREDNQALIKALESLL